MPAQQGPVEQHQAISLDFLPGYGRDGTKFDSNRYLDGLWNRFRLGRPRKIGGFKEVFDQLAGVPRRAHLFYDGSQIIVHIGTTVSLQQVVIDALSGNLISSADRTPAGFVGGDEVGWTLDAIFDTTSNVVQLIAHAVPDTAFLSSQTQLIPYLGQINSATPVSPFTEPSDLFSGNYTQPLLAGGVVTVQPYVFGYDKNGLVYWSAPNLPNYLGVAQGTSGAGQARVSAQKIVAGMPLRGGGVNSPAALFWSLSELITATFVGGTPIWSFNTISPSSSILSSDCVIEYDGLYFWLGIGRALVYNGTVVEVPNPYNQDWFFDNLNWQYAAKTYAMKVPAFGEIWWCAPMFGNKEPSHALIYNVRDNIFYDTELPNGGRSAGYFAQGTRYPIMGGSTRGKNGYSLWLHETGTDEVGLSGTKPVRAYFETGYLGGPKNSPPDDRGISYGRYEPDFVQTGDLNAYLLTSANARAPERKGKTLPVKFVSDDVMEQFAGMKLTSRLARLHVESNTLGGSYIAGRNLLHGTPSTARVTS